MAPHRQDEQQAQDGAAAALVNAVERKGLWGQVSTDMTADQKRDVHAALDRHSKRK